MKDIFEYHKKQIKKQYKKYPLMEYFLSNKPIKECSKECQEQVILLAGGGPNIWLDTHAREVQGFWGSTKYTKYIYDYEYIIDYFDEFYQCIK